VVAVVGAALGRRAVPRLRRPHLLRASDGAVDIVAVALASVAGSADREEAQALAAPLEAESVVVHVVTDDDENLPRPPTSRNVRAAGVHG
jgi:hypothetical protein